MADAPAPIIPVRCSYTELRPVAALVPHPRNPNQHPQAQIVALSRIIKAQGWRSPIVISARSGFIVAGHGRYEAAKLLGVECVPVDGQEFATEADEYAHLLADNRIAELAELDQAQVKALLLDLRAESFDLDLTGFDSAAVNDLLTDLQAPSEFREYGEDIETEHCCPKCGYRWSGKSSAPDVDEPEQEQEAIAE
jgi:ParB-like chromosome segregation protein Spo0J